MSYEAIYLQRWDWSDRCTHHHGNSDVSDRSQPANLPAGRGAEDARPARHADTDSGR